MSTLVVVGLSHLSAPVAVRERLSIGAGRVPEETELLRAALGAPETVLLSTCSRFEIYSAGTDPAEAEAKVRAWILQRCGADTEPYLYSYCGEAAVEHLFRVASGLDSWILGETEILGQVRSAYETASRLRLTGRTLNILFQKALNAGKEVRTRTPIAQGVSSVGGAAAILARKVFGEGGARSVTVFGAGTMAESAARHLLAKGACRLTVANRTLEKAQELARALGGAAADFEAGIEGLAEADVAIFSTGAHSAVLDCARLAPLLAARRGRPLFLIDVGVPRNVEPAAADLEGTYLYDIDDLKRMVATSRESRKDGLADATGLCRKLAGECWAKLTERGVRV